MASALPLNEEPLLPEYKQELETEERKYYLTESSHEKSSDDAGEESTTGLVAASAKLSCGAPPMAAPAAPSCGTRPKEQNTVTLTVTPKTLCSPLQQGLQIAKEQGEDTRGFHVFPVTERHVDGQVVREHSPVPLKTLKDPKQACTTYGPTAPFTLAMLEGFQGEALPPSD